VSPACEQLKDFLSRIRLNAPRFKVFSNTTANPYPTDPEGITRQLVQHLINRVEFVREIEAMYQDGARIFVEVGPGTVLSGLVDQILADRPHLTVISNQAGRSGLAQLHHLLGQLAVHGVPVKMDRIYEGRSLKEIDLKTLCSEPHQAALSPTTWLVNGARAKPFKEVSGFDPNKAITPVNLTVTEETTAPASVERKEARISTSKTQDEPRIDIPPAPARASSPEATFSAGPSLSGDETNHVMLQFQRLMQRFLEIQKSVTMSYLRGTVDEAELSAAEIDETLRNLTLPTPSSPAGHHVPSPSEQHQAQSQESFSEQTLIQAPMTSEISAQAAVSSPSSGEAPVDREELTLQLRHIVSERTGYPQEMLDLDLDLEADFNGVRRLYVSAWRELWF